MSFVECSALPGEDDRDFTITSIVEFGLLKT